MSGGTMTIAPRDELTSLLTQALREWAVKDSNLRPWD